MLSSPFNEPNPPQTDFWKWFKQNEAAFLNLGKGQVDASGALFHLVNRVEQVHPDLTCELGPVNETGKRELVISADGIRDAFVDAVQLAEAAPKMENWRIIALRPRGRQLEALKLGNYLLDPEKIPFTYELKRNDLVITVYLDAVDRELPFQRLAVLVLLDCLAGEYDAATKIGELKIEEKALLLPDATPLNLDMLPFLIDELKSGRLGKAVPIKSMPTQTEQDPYQVDEQFVLLKTEIDQLPRIDMVNLNFYHFSKKSEFPWLLCLDLPYPTRSDGLPEIDALNKLNAFEMEVLKRLREVCQGYFVFHTTWNGQRRSYFHVNHLPKARALLFQMEREPQFPALSYRFAYEKDWETVRALLYHAKKG
ncbi:MAG: DUF695 domain-containing protein [Bacteroidota bacterium]